MSGDQFHDAFLNAIMEGSFVLLNGFIDFIRRYPVLCLIILGLILATRCVKAAKKHHGK